MEYSGRYVSTKNTGKKIHFRFRSSHAITIMSNTGIIIHNATSLDKIDYLFKTDMQFSSRVNGGTGHYIRSGTASLTSDNILMSTFCKYPGVLSVDFACDKHMSSCRISCTNKSLSWRVWLAIQRWQSPVPWCTRRR